jgi:hypothetical protein
MSKKYNAGQPVRASVKSGAVLGNQGRASDPGAGYLNAKAKIIGAAVTRGINPGAAKDATQNRGSLGVFDAQLGDLGGGRK